MRLLTRKDGRLTVTKSLHDDIPQYAILSHTWGKEEEEVNFQDMMADHAHNKPGFGKIGFCEAQAARDGLDHFWVDTCCIDQTNAVEHQEAIASMYRWYQNAERCYVFLSDVIGVTRDQVSDASTTGAIRDSRWFTRGWTLQELLAPQIVQFFSKDGTLLGDKISLEWLLHERTGISKAAIRGAPLAEFSVDERLSWADCRQTKRPEDRAYSLLGIFDVYMPLLYGEGKDRALQRLRREIDGLHSITQSPLTQPPSRSIHNLISGKDEKTSGIQASMGMRESTDRSQLSGHVMINSGELSITKIHEVASSSANAVIKPFPARMVCRDIGCGCVCHLRSYYRTPFFLSRMIGAVTYRGVCRNHPAGRGDIKLSLPEWLTNYNVYVHFEKAVNGTPSLGLRFQRKVAWGSEDTIIRFSFLGDTEGIKAILQKGNASLDDTEPNHGLTALHYAVQKNHLEACKLLLQAGSDRFAIDESNMYANISSLVLYLHGIKTLTGALRSPTDKAWEHIFSDRGSPEGLDLLRSLFPTDDFDCWGFSQLHSATLRIEGLSLEALLKTQVPIEDINTKDSRGRTALHWAALRGDLKAAEILLENNADVDCVDEFNCTPLIYAVSRALPRLVEILILRRAEVNIVNNRGDSPLHYAARHKDDVQTVKILVHAGAQVDRKNGLGNTPFAGAAITNRVSSGDFLLRNGANRYTSNKYGDTPLRETIHHNCHEFLEMLLRMETEYHDTNKSGSSILHAAALEGDVKTIAILSSFNLSGLDVDLRNDKGLTAAEVCDNRIGASDTFKEKFSNLITSLKSTASFGSSECIDVSESHSNNDCLQRA